MMMMVIILLDYKNYICTRRADRSGFVISRIEGRAPAVPLTATKRIAYQLRVCAATPRVCGSEQFRWSSPLITLAMAAAEITNCQ